MIAAELTREEMLTINESIRLLTDGIHLKSV